MTGGRSAGPAPAGLRLSFDRKLSIRIFLAILCTAVLALTVVAPTYRDFTLARQNLYDIQHYKLILDTANLLAAERGPANIVMSEEPSSDGTGAKRLADIRARGDAALAGLVLASDVPFGLHNHPVPSDMVVGVRDQLALARGKVDRLAALPRSSLNREELQDAIESMFEVSNRFQAIVAWRANELVQHDTGLAAPVLVGRMLSDLRDYGGRIASQIMAPIATGQKLPQRNIIDSRQSQGRLLELWRVISSHSALYDNPSLAKSRAEIEQRFFGDGLNLVDRLITEDQNGNHHSLTATELTNLFVPTMRPIEAYRSAFLDSAVDYYARAKTKSLMTLSIVVLITATILGILLQLILSIRTHIFRPLLHAHEEVIRLAEDRPGAPQSLRLQAGEMLTLFQAIEVLRGKLQERASVTSELRVQADTDGLTALLNRRAFDRFALSSLSVEDASGAVCLILMDIDHFKAVNDTYGHPAGDRVLVRTAELLRSNLRSGDIIARFGGEEFAVLVLGNNLSGAISIAKKLRLALQRERFTTPDGTPFRVTASFGVARGRRGEGAWWQLLELADAALYRAKADGRNRVRFVRDALPTPT